MNKKIENLKKQVKDIKNEFLKTQDFFKANVLKNIEWTLQELENFESDNIGEQHALIDKIVAVFSVKWPRKI